MSMRFVDPFDTLLSLQRALETPRSAFDLATTGAGTFPPVNVFQRGSDYVVVAELPGLDKSTLMVEVQENQVRIAGERPETSEENRSYHRREQPAGRFDRTVTFPVPVDANSATAQYEDGLLTVTVEPAQEARPRVVAVT